MHSHCAIFNEQEWEERQNINVSSCDGPLLIRMSPWTTHMLRLETVRNRFQTWTSHPILLTSYFSSWGSLSCCSILFSVFIISQHRRRRRLVHHPTAFCASPMLSLVNMETSVTVQSLHPLHLSITLYHTWLDAPHIPMRNMWLLVNDLLLCALRRSGDCMLRFIPDKDMFMFHYSSLWRISEVMLISRCDILFMWQGHCMVHEEEQHLVVYHRREPACGNWSQLQSWVKVLIQPHVHRGRTPTVAASFPAALQLHTVVCLVFLESRWQIGTRGALKTEGYISDAQLTHLQCDLYL